MLLLQTYLHYKLNESISLYWQMFSTCFKLLLHFHFSISYLISDTHICLTMCVSCRGTKKGLLIGVNTEDREAHHIGSSIQMTYPLHLFIIFFFTMLIFLGQTHCFKCHLSSAEEDEFKNINNL